MTKNIFKYPDTNSSRAKIEVLNQKFHGQKIAIIGLGGTGSYILDLVSKAPVDEIHLFDPDDFLLHNAFRAPGAIEGSQFGVAGGLKKVHYYKEVYSRIHNGIYAHEQYVNADNIHELQCFSYVFICVDKNTSRSILTQALLQLKVPFIDVGLGVQIVGDCLIGTLRITTITEQKNDHLSKRIGSDEFVENEYATNIQIADLNCLNATLAVLKWKKLCGFYQDLKKEQNSLYFINTNKLFNEDPDTSIC